METATTTPKSHVYIVEAGNETTEVTGRDAAIEHAKEVSQSTWRPIRVERQDRRVKMQFRRGSLQTYRYDSQHRRS